MIKAVIIEDDSIFADLVNQMLTDFFPEISVEGRAASVTEGKILIETVHPDLVFMDIELTDGTTFHILRQLKQINFQLIFITAFNEYAIHAFKFSAIDYLLKPVNPFEFKEAVERALGRIAKQEQQLHQAMLHNYFSAASEKKIVLRTLDEIHIVPVCEIIRCQSDNSYTTFYLERGEAIVVSKGLKEFEEVLLAHLFFKPHQSHLINLRHLRKVDKSEGGELIMSDKSKVPLALRKKQELNELLKKL